MAWHGDGLLRATARPAMAVLGGLTLSITTGNKGNKNKGRFLVYTPQKWPFVSKYTKQIKKNYHTQR